MLDLLQGYQDILNSTIMFVILIVPLILILCDFGTGVSASLIQRTFQCQRLSAILQSGVFPYLLILSLGFFCYLLSGSTLCAKLVLSLGIMLQNLVLLGSIVSNITECQKEENQPDPVWLARNKDIPWTQTTIPIEKIPTQTNLPGIHVNLPMLKLPMRPV